MRVAVVVLVAFSLVCGRAPFASAQSAPPVAGPPEAPSPESTARAAEIKKRGDDAMDGGRPADALTAYVEAYALTKDPALLYNKGRALQGLGEYPHALDELEAFEKAAPPELRARVPGLAKQLMQLRERVTTVSIACDTIGARVRFRDRSLGQCPLPKRLRLTSGRGTLEVIADGYFPYIREIDLPPGGAASLDVRLASMANTAILVVRANVPNTEVSIDGKPFGMVPVEAMLSPGSHALELHREGYRSTSTSAILTPGERRNVEVALQAEDGVLAKWWFWTAVGAVVAGGVVTVIALTTEKSPDAGTVPPGVVRGGLSRDAGFRF
jgi:hypothetical protein